jgi:hypothetical protein
LKNFLITRGDDFTIWPLDQGPAGLQQKCLAEIIQIIEAFKILCRTADSSRQILSEYTARVAGAFASTLRVLCGNVANYWAGLKRARAMKRKTTISRI